MSKSTTSTLLMLLCMAFVVIATVSLPPGATSGNTSVSQTSTPPKPQDLPQDIPALASTPANGLPMSPPLPTFAWGHVTKYSRILYHDSVVVKGPTIMDIKYPEIDNTNSFTIIGIKAFPNEEISLADPAGQDNHPTTGNSYLHVFPVKGGIEFNATVIRFSLNTTRELNYTLMIHGVDV